MARKNSAHDLVVESLTEALLLLMEKKKLDEITVSELCKKAGVSRVSFYRNYYNISDILVDYFSTDTEKWWNSYNGEQDGTPTELFWREFFAHMQKHERFLKTIYAGNAAYVLRTVIFRSCGPRPEDGDDEAFARAMLAGAIYGYTDEWIRRGMKEYPKYQSLKGIAEAIPEFAR